MDKKDLKFLVNTFKRRFRFCKILRIHVDTLPKHHVGEVILFRGSTGRRELRIIASVSNDRLIWYYFF